MFSFFAASQHGHGLCFLSLSCLFVSRCFVVSPLRITETNVSFFYRLIVSRRKKIGLERK